MGDDPRDTVPERPIKYQRHPRPWYHTEAAGGIARIIYDAEGQMVVPPVPTYEAADMICDSVNRVFPQP